MAAKSDQYVVMVGEPGLGMFWTKVAKLSSVNFRAKPKLFIEKFEVVTGRGFDADKTALFL